MAAGMLKSLGYYYGDRLIPPRAANPKGFFESAFINHKINEAILARALPKFKEGQRWLSVFPLNKKLYTNTVINNHIKKMTKKEKFCYKDPRFCYTLPTWRPFVEDAVYICVFRYPTSTVSSILKECRSAKYLRSFIMTEALAYTIWHCMYSHVVARHMHKGDWLFIHYDQLFLKKGVDKFSEFIGSPVDATFPSKKYKRPVVKAALPKSVRILYRKLCKLAKI
jgi:hypothetical protein